MKFSIRNLFRKKEDEKTTYLKSMGFSDEQIKNNKDIFDQLTIEQLQKLPKTFYQTTFNIEKMQNEISDEKIEELEIITKSKNPDLVIDNLNLLDSYNVSIALLKNDLITDNIIKNLENLSKEDINKLVFVYDFVSLHTYMNSVNFTQDGEKLLLEYLVENPKITSNDKNELVQSVRTEDDFKIAKYFMELNLPSNEINSFLNHKRNCASDRLNYEIIKKIDSRFFSENDKGHEFIHLKKLLYCTEEEINYVLEHDDVIPLELRLEKANYAKKDNIDYINHPEKYISAINYLLLKKCFNQLDYLDGNLCETNIKRMLQNSEDYEQVISKNQEIFDLLFLLYSKTPAETLVKASKLEIYSDIEKNMEKAHKLEQAFLSIEEEKYANILNASYGPDLKYDEEKELMVKHLEGEEFVFDVHVITSSQIGSDLSTHHTLFENPKAWFAIENNNRYISTSVITNDHLGKSIATMENGKKSWEQMVLQKNVILGFNNLKPSHILYACECDGAVNNKAQNFQARALISFNDLFSGNEGNHNEVVIPRYDQKTGERLAPNYILCFDEIDELSLKFAKELELPVYLIHTDKYDKKESNLVTNTIEKKQEESIASTENIGKTGKR